MPVSLFLAHFSQTKLHSVSSKLDHSKTLIQISKDYIKKIQLTIYKAYNPHITYLKVYSTTVIPSSSIYSK